VAIYKRGRVYWYKLMWDGKVIRESTKQKKRQGCPSDGSSAPHVSGER
jgi:hypothetical protein